ncbi:MAG: hypothetical protein GX620_03040 [Chloroflexi bacterium]|nr:hypothetical protein [Chloroflexota bacterium]
MYLVRQAGGWFRRQLEPRLGGVVRGHEWVAGDVVVPFVLTRIGLLLVGWFSAHFPMRETFPHPEVLARGWWFSPHRWIDIWGRWDTGWYLDIVRHGYYLKGELGIVENNVNFFPLFPYVVRALVFIIPAGVRTDGAILALGALISSTAAVVGLAFVVALVRKLWCDGALARRVVWYMLLFPAGFVLSCFLSEGLYLCVTAAAFWAANRRAWWAAGIFGALAALTRPLGVLVVVPLAWMYAEQIQWDVHKLRVGHLLWLALIPGAWVGLMGAMYTLTGHPLTPYASQRAWGWVDRFYWPWQTLLHPAGSIPYIEPIQRVVVVLFIALSIVALVKLPSRSYGIYMVSMVLPALLGKPSLPTIRYAIVLFPGFILLARLGRHEWVHGSLIAVMWTVQVLLFFAWCQLYYVL